MPTDLSLVTPVALYAIVALLVPIGFDAILRLRDRLAGIR